ncbi:MAG TPA: hypothetical protein VJC18_03030, partial [bacterium]|nr:hypothetical protein [bacterium]
MQINKINHVTTLTLSALAFLILFSYGIARPAAESLFLKAHGNEALPHVWLWLTVVMLAVAALYNHLLCRISLVPLFGAVAVFFALLPAFFIVLVKAEIPGSHYALYIWKDVYIIVLVEIFYTFLNSVFPIKLARWYYGFFGMIAALGGSVASFLVGPLAKWGGTRNSLWLVTATLLLCAALCWPLSRSALNISPSSFKNKRTHLINACQVVRQS